MSEETQSPVETDEFAPTTWGSEDGVGQFHALTVPSGQKCLVIRPGVAGLMEADILHNVDGLTALVEKHISKARGKRPSDRKRKGQSDTDVDMDALMKDTKALKDIMEVVNKAMVAFIVKPPIKMDPDDLADREPGQIYVSMIDINDRMFIFNYMVGGSPDLTSFRDGLTEVVGSMEAQQGAEQPSE